MKETEGRLLYNCSVCGKEAGSVFLLMAGPVGKVCSECIISGMDVLSKEIKNKLEPEESNDE